MTNILGIYLFLSVSLILSLSLSLPSYLSLSLSLSLTFFLSLFLSLSLITPRRNIPQKSNLTATNLPSLKPSKFEEQDMHDTVET